MKSKESMVCIRLNEKARFCMEELGYLDKNTGRKRKSGMSISDFLNQAIVDVFEKNGETAKLSWVNWQLKQMARKHTDMYLELDALRKQKDELESSILRTKHELMQEGFL